MPCAKPILPAKTVAAGKAKAAGSAIKEKAGAAKDKVQEKW